MNILNKCPYMENHDSISDVKVYLSYPKETVSPRLTRFVTKNIAIELYLPPEHTARYGRVSIGALMFSLSVFRRRRRLHRLYLRLCFFRRRCRFAF